MNYILTLFIVEFVLILLGFVGFVFAINVVKNYNPEISSTKQFGLAKNGYLISTIIAFILIVKLPLFLYFVWTMDEISGFVPGAMCAAGIVSATYYGVWMFFIKIINLFLLSAWLLVHFEDSKTADSKFLKLKFKIFLPLFVLLVVEFVLEILHFKGISLERPVLCCSDLFSKLPDSELKFWYSSQFLIFTFYASFIALFLSAKFRIDIFVAFFSPVFMFATWQALIRVFSPYIYELPTHKCPYCLLQGDYNYMGYFVYILIFVGTLPGLFVFILEILNSKQNEYLYKVSMTTNSLLVLVLSYYPISYYIKNGVWL